jgi:hypothetical protein
MAHHAIKKPSSATLAAVVADFRNEIGTNRTNLAGVTMSVVRRRPEVVDGRPKRRD